MLIAVLIYFILFDLNRTLSAGHMSAVKALAIGQSRAVSCSVDGTVIFWKLENSVTLAKIMPNLVKSNPDCAPEELILCLEDTVLVVRMGHRLQVIEVHSGKVLYTDAGSMDVPVITSTCDGQMLVVFYDGTHIVKVKNLQYTMCLMCKCYTCKTMIEEC